MASPPASPRRTRATVRWETAVREEKELDSSIVTTLDSGCTVFIVESQTLQSGRERCRIDEPVVGWVSRLLLEEAVESDDDDDEESVALEPSKKRATGLSSNERVAVISLRGNDRCFHCFARIEGLWCPDGERAYGCASKGIVACSQCGIARNYGSLEDDAWAPHHVAALCLGGNGRLRHHLEKVGASDPAVSAPYISAYAEHLAVAACDAVKACAYEAHWLDDEESSIRNRRDACVKLVASQIESRDVAPDQDERAVELRTNDGKLGLELAEVHGGRCAVIKCSAWTEQVRPGDYVVAVGDRRCWRYAPVVKAISKAKKRGIVKLLLRRVDVAQQELEQKDAPPTSATNEAWASQKQNGSQSKVQSYWDARASRSFDSEDGEVAAITNTLRPVPPTPALVAAVVPAGAPLGSKMTRDEDFALVDGARVVGVNGDRDRVSYDRVVEALATAARPLLVLLASAPQEATPKREKKVVRLPEGPLGLRLADARSKDGAPVARVARVAPGGRAWKGGVVVGDVLTVVDGDNVAGYAHALALLADRRPCAATFEFRGDAVDVVAAAPAAPASLFEKWKAPAAELARNLAADLETLKADLTPSKEEPPPPPPVLPQVSSGSLGSSPPSADGKEVYLFS